MGGGGAFKVLQNLASNLPLYSPKIHINKAFCFSPIWFIQSPPKRTTSPTCNITLFTSGVANLLIRARPVNIQEQILSCIEKIHIHPRGQWSGWQLLSTSSFAMQKCGLKITRSLNFSIAVGNTKFQGNFYILITNSNFSITFHKPN